MTTKAQTQETPKTQSDVNALTNPEFSEIDESVLERQQADRAQKMKAIRFLSMPTKKSTDLIGVPFDIVDAVKTRINDEESISFIINLHSDKQNYKVNKAKNLFTEAYLDYFETFTEGEKIQPMYNFTFVQLAEGGKAGNLPIVLQPVN